MVKISVIIPTYRRPDLLKKCLIELNGQYYPKQNYEVIVVSDGPDPMTAKLISGLSFKDMQFKFIQMPVKKGPAAARNYGWKLSSGVLIAFTDDDTLPHPKWLSAISDAYKGDKEIAFTGKIKVPLSKVPTDYERNTAGLET